MFYLRDRGLYCWTNDKMLIIRDQKLTHLKIIHELV